MDSLYPEGPDRHAEVASDQRPAPVVNCHLGCVRTWEDIMDLTPLEASRRAEGTESLLVDMRAGHGIRGTAAWWDHTFVQLGGRTPTEALRDGDDDQVRALIDHWYEQSEEGAERLRQDPDFVKMIRAKSEALRRTA
jgi:hypothetical protein